MQDLVDELDLELVHALQLNPRASWTALARALGIDPVTVARRWERLRGAGLAWTSCVPGPVTRGSILRMLYVELECEPGGLDAAIEHLAAQPHVIFLHHTTGSRSLLAAVAVADLPAASAYTRQLLDHTPGVRAQHAELLLTTYGEASRWRLGTLEPAQQQTLRTEPAVPDEQLLQPDATDQRLIRALIDDARLPVTELADRIGVSEPTARRRLNRLIGAGRVRLRCEIAQPVSGWPVTAVLWCRLPPAQLDATARSVAGLPEIRLSIGLTGPDNLMLIAWLRDPAQLPELEATLATRFPQLAVSRHALALRTVKHLGRLLNGQGLAASSVPVDIWQPESGGS
ncbi:Lrp/AsnC family transcriptional regulator [Kitasatospora acidiphila]|nr:Lrp/AsnC family transcriptional regulator [Kitasatospora acidiphila]